MCPWRRLAGLLISIVLTASTAPVKAAAPTPMLTAYGGHNETMVPIWVGAEKGLFRKYGIDLRGDEFGWHLVNRRHALRVLGSQRRDHRRAVHSAGRKRLQIGLDAGPATRIGTGDGEGDGNRHEGLLAHDPFRGQ